MKRAILTLSAGLALLLGLARPADAQYANPFVNPRYGSQLPQGAPPPPVSPYLNLVRGNNPALGYYLGALPEFERQRFQNDVVSGLTGFELFAAGRAQQPLQVGDIPVLPQTGHLSAFQAFGSYYTYPGQQRPYYPLNPSQARMLPR
jgi:hypothetical protein